MRLSFLLASTLFALPSLDSLADWPEFRGPTGQGQGQADTATLPLEWSPKVGKNIVWQAEVPGVGWSSPIVVADRIYLTTAVPARGIERPDADRSLRALCLTGADGKVLWDQEVFTQEGRASPAVHKKNSHASPTPVFEGGRLYVHFGHQGTACLDAATGRVIWSTRDFAYQPVHGNGGSPVIEGGLLIFNADAATDPAVIALDKNTGRERWRFARQSAAQNKFSFSTPLVIEAAGRRQLITPGSGVVNSLDPATGAEIWRATYDQGYSVVPRPLFAHGLVIICTGYNKPTAIAIRPDGKGDVTRSHIAWTLEKYMPHNPSPVAVGDEIYFVADNGILTCADIRTGKVHYQERCTGPISASILHASGRLYLQDEKGQGIIAQPGPTFRILAKNDLGARSLASYSIIATDLLIRTENHLWRVGQRP